MSTAVKLYVPRDAAALAVGADAVAAALAGWASPLWVAFFTVTTLRTWYMSRPDLVGRFKPLQIGVLEIVLSVFAFVIGLF